MNGLTATLIATTAISLFEAIHLSSKNRRLKAENRNMERLIDHYKMIINSVYGGNIPNGQTGDTNEKQKGE
jgi:hypothetical protein